MERSSSFDTAEVDETKLWSELSTDAWKNSITNRTIFADLYTTTRKMIAMQVLAGGHDVVLDVGCGTGDISGELTGVKVPRIGVDINEQFVSQCTEQYTSKDKNVTYHVGDATQLNSWWKEKGFAKKYFKPLIICCNNTLPIMPPEIRSAVVSEMQTLAADKGKCMITLWNGRFFSHALLGYYKNNPSLCGQFDLSPKCVDWENREVQTYTGYNSKWLFPGEVLRWFRSLNLQMDLAEPQQQTLLPGNHVREIGLGVFVWFNGEKGASPYYCEDANKFYGIWGKRAIHIGRYDKKAEMKTLPVDKHIQAAQDLHEAEMVKHIRTLMGNTKFRALDMGCGYGGLLRVLESQGMLWSGVEVDLSKSMIEQAIALNKAAGIGPALIDARRESFVDVSLDDGSCDLVLSMDALLHVGSSVHPKVLEEAWRVLRPGGWLVFTDIMARPDASAKALAPLLKRLGVSGFGTVKGYISAGQAQGFGNADFQDHSENISTHYTSVHAVLEEKTDLNLGADFKKNLSADLRRWFEVAPGNLQWGIISMQKVGRPATTAHGMKRKVSELSSHDPMWHATHTGVDH